MEHDPRADADALLRLLGGRVVVARMGPSGKYDDARHEATIDELVAHYAGRIALGVVCAHEAKNKAA